jgi:uncharacterized iron-regulated membrane protein
LKQLRRIFFWCHLFAGVVAAVIIFIMSVTGVLLTYERQIISWADTRSYQVSRPAPDAARLPIEALLDKALRTLPAAPTAVIIYNDTAAPVAISFPGGRRLFVDPYTGEPFGEGSPRVRVFFRVVTDWHRWLAASGENRATGRAVTGAANLFFLFLVVSGFYLWWPRKWTRRALRSVTWIRRGQGGQARDFNWHNVIGFWSALPLFVVVLSGVVISYAWASNLVFKLVGEEPPAQLQRGGPPAGSSQQAGGAAAAFEGLDALLVRAERQVEDWRSINMQVPARQDAPVSFSIDRGNGGQPHLRSQLTLVRPSGEVLRWELSSNNSTGRRLRAWLRFAHTGEVYGIIGQTIAGLASLGGAFLVFTGLSLTCRRFSSWMGRRRRAPHRSSFDITSQQPREDVE